MIRNQVIVMVMVLMVIVCVVACSPRIIGPSAGTAKDVASQMTYVQDTRTGICYSVIRSVKINSVTDATISHTAVPCEKIPKNLLVK